MAVALGPGVLKIGPAGTLRDYSCLVNGMTLSTDIAVGTSTFKLCGTEVPGTLVPTGTLAGSVDQDIDAAAGSGLFQYLSEHWGDIAAFEFEPSTSAGLTAKGSLLVVPAAFGGSTYGDPMASDVSFSTVGDISFGNAGTTSWVQTMSPKVSKIVSAATGATAGTPGTWTPPGATPPASVAAIGAVVASPATAWTSGQYVQTGTAGVPGQAHWSGTAWTAGPA